MNKWERLEQKEEKKPLVTSKTYLDVLIVEFKNKKRWKCVYEENTIYFELKHLIECLHNFLCPELFCSGVVF